jgi:hypothetical protein
MRLHNLEPQILTYFDASMIIENKNIFKKLYGSKQAGWPDDIFEEVDPKCHHNQFWPKLRHNWYRGKRSPKFCSASIIFVPLPKEKNRPVCSRKFAQSGHPESKQGSEKTWKRFEQKKQLLQKKQLGSKFFSRGERNFQWRL